MAIQFLRDHTHTRDALGRRTGLAVDLVTGFDSADWSVDTTVAEHANAYTYDHLNQLTRVTQSGGVSGNAGVAAKRVDLEYDNAGRNTKVKRRDSLADSAAIVAETTTTYTTGNAAGKVAKIETTNSSSQAIARDTYTYDFAFFRTSTFKTGVGAAEHTTTYQYDTTGQLISADDSATTGVDENYVWDLNGNRKNPGDSVSVANQLTSAGGIRYIYDEEGNVKEERNSAGTVVLRSFNWDYRQRLTKATFKDVTGTTTTKTVEYAYDTFNRLVSKTVTEFSGGSPQTPVVQYFVHDEETMSSGGSMSPSPLAGEGRGEGARGDVILELLDTDGAGGNAPAVAKRFLWSTAVDQLFAQEDVLQNINDVDRFIWLLQDKLGTVRTALNRDGTVNAVLDYDAFGRLTSITDANGQTLSVPPTYFGYTAQFYDVDTGLVWYSDGTGRGRWFSPVLQRFINRDEPMLRDGPNPYPYVHNSPTNATDPSGQAVVSNKPQSDADKCDGPFRLYRPWEKDKPAYVPKGLRKKPDPIPPFFDRFFAPGGGCQKDLQHLGNQHAENKQFWSEFKFGVVTTTVAVFGELLLNQIPLEKVAVTVVKAGWPLFRKFKILFKVGDDIVREIVIDKKTLEQIAEWLNTQKGGKATHSIDDAMKWLEEAYKKDLDDLAKLAASRMNKHHPLPKFLGGDLQQLKSKIPECIHKEYHALLRDKLKAAGFKLHENAGAEAWADYFAKNPGEQAKAFNAVLETSREIDKKYSTNITQDAWQNIVDKNFKAKP